jgi:Zn-dependent peptidase ImmA (M78 family)
MNKQDKRTEEESSRDDVLDELRKMMPLRPLRMHEHLVIAERQATHLNRLLDQRGPSVDLAWITRLEAVTVVLQPRWKMDGLSGMTVWSDGRWVIGVNKGNSHSRRRFTLGHEFKHLLDATRDKVTYRNINPAQREVIANYFAACYLMPKAWVRRAWTGGLQDVEGLAGLFNVSVEAMKTRLTYLGFIDSEPDRQVATYFRTDTAVTELAA